MLEGKTAEGNSIHIRIGTEILELQGGESIFDLLRRQEKADLSFCGGKGICGRCRVKFLENATLPSATERHVFTPVELRNGMRLACVAKPKKECEIELLFPEGEAQDKIVTAYNNPYHKQKSNSFGESVIAIDLGTTTIAMQKLEKETGEIVGEYCVMNPQRAYGADVISRMEASNKGSRAHLQKLVKEALLKGIKRLAPEEGTKIILAGNTVMGHLLQGYPVKSLSKAPFIPIDIAQTILELEAHKIIIMPGISAFVGGDILAGLLAVPFRNTNRTNLFLDLGTNGELAIGNQKDILCTATAAGPAFEGGATARTYGSDMITITAELLETGALDETGLLREPYFTEGITIHKVLIRQQDIRDLQMAKAAVFAGIEILLQERGITSEEIEHVYLAGGFGYHLEVKKAIRIGLFPQALAEKVVTVGNTSLLGAYLYGKNQEKYEKVATELLASARSINLANRPEFEELYLGALNFRK